MTDLADPATLTDEQPGAEADLARLASSRLAWLRRHPDSVITFVTVTACALFVLKTLHPSLLVLDTTPTGGDIGAHVWAPAYLRDHLLPHGRITGWADAWYAGFPVYHFYMVVAPLLIVALDLVLPYGIAFKLVTVMGVVSLPVCAWAFGRLTRLPFPAPAMLAIATLPFIYDRGFSIWGGNLASTLAGEFAYSMALSLGVLYLGVLIRACEDRRHRAWVAGLLALCGLTHLIVAFSMVAATVVTMVVMGRRRPRLWRFLAPVWLVAALVSAVWTLPFVVERHMTIDMGWTKLTDYQAQLLPARSMWAVLLAIPAIGWGVRTRNRTVACMVGWMVASALMVRFVPEGRLWNARLLPFYLLTLYLLAGLGFAQVARAVGDLRGSTERFRWKALAPMAALPLTLVYVGLPMDALPFTTHAPDGSPQWLGLSAPLSYTEPWVRWNYEGYERKAKWPEYAGIMDTMGRIGHQRGCGRAMWEYGEKQLDPYGTTMSMMLLPYWTDQCIGSMEGLYFESSATTPFHFLTSSEVSKDPSRPVSGLTYRDLDLAYGVEHMQLLGVRYYLAFTPEAIAQADGRPELTRIATSGPWVVYELAGADLAVGLDHLPYVEPGNAKDADVWRTTGVATWDRFGDDRAYAAPSGPASWPRIATGDALPYVPVTDPAKVTNIDMRGESISFDVDQIGKPVLVKISWFPSWRATGADGPYRVSPNLMVVVPTAKHVTLTYGRSPYELIGALLTVVGLLSLVLLARRDRATRAPGGPDLPAS